MDVSGLEVVYREFEKKGWKGYFLPMSFVLLLTYIITISVGSVREYVVGLEGSLGLLAIN